MILFFVVQVEGLVADYDLTLGNLIGIIRTFFEKIGKSSVLHFDSVTGCDRQ